MVQRVLDNRALLPLCAVIVTFVLCAGGAPE
jgi:hypothetical protein